MGLMLNLGLRKLWQYNFGSPMLPIFTCIKIKYHVFYI